MNKMLTLSIACMALVFSSAMAPAQQNGLKDNDGKGKVGRQLNQRREGMQKLLQSLNLTEEQKTKIKEIMKKSREDVQAVLKGEGERKDKAEKVKAIRKETQEAIRNVLTDEQKKKYDEAVSKAREKTSLKRDKRDKKV